jgi:hypothetical protein
MARKLTMVPLVVIVCLAGCSSSRRAPIESLDEARTKDTNVMAMERLQSENLPALQSVELWDNPYGPGLKLTTDHYCIFTTLLEPLLLRTLPGYIESAYWGYNDQLPQPIETVAKFDIYLFAQRKEWESFTHAFAGDQATVFCKIKTGAYYLNGACVVYDIGRKRTLSAIGHEGWHQFNSRHFKYRLPSWLDEGIAMLFETCTYENGMYSFDAARNYQRLGTLSETLTNGKQMLLKDLIATSPGEVLATDENETVMAFYSQSYALVRFLREADRGKRVTRYHRLLWDGLLGEWPLDKEAGRTAEDRNLSRTVQWNRIVGPQLFERYVGNDFERLEQEYSLFCRRIVGGMAFVRADEEKASRPDVYRDR